MISDFGPEISGPSSWFWVKFCWSNGKDAALPNSDPWVRQFESHGGS